MTSMPPYQQEPQPGYQPPLAQPMSVYHYAMPAPPKPQSQSQSRTLSVWGLILGASGFVLPWFVNSIVGVVLAAVGLAKEPRGKAMAVSGLVLSIVSLVMTPLTWLFQMAILGGLLSATSG